MINYYSNAPLIVKLLALPFTIAFSIYAVYFVYEKLGAPMEGMPHGKFEYIWHKSTPGGEEIILWAEQETENRLYIFEYNRENMKELEKARQQKEQQTIDGVSMEMIDGMVNIIDNESTPDEIGSDARIKQETRQNENAEIR